ncbi:MAG: ABC transporter substrate-binding protein [Alphaproteobacteria bacterium]|nr:ABC transporter substrate-binding protein [Alphaproteobacteria bacterium]
MQRKSILSRLGTVILSGLCLSLLLPLPASAQAQQPVRGGTLTYAVIGEPPNFDCHGQLSYAAIHFLAPHYALLVKFDPERFPEVTGDLAQRWTVSPDGLTYAFTLHDNVRFHDGSALTSRDIKVTFDRLRAPPQGVTSLRRSEFANIDAIDTPDARTVVFRLKRPQPYFLGILANPFNCVYSADMLARDADYPARKIMGAGPFVFVNYTRGDSWTGRRFDGYFRSGRPYLDGFRGIVAANTNVAVTALEGGQVQAEFRGFPPPIRDRLVRSMGDRVRIEESIWALSVLVAFNAGRAPFNDARVRRALSLAIDRWQAAQVLSRSVSVRIVGGTQRPGSPFAATDQELESFTGYSRDIAASRAEARRLLREAGHEGLRFRLSNRNTNDPYVATGIFLIDQWRQIGVTAEHVLLETAPWTRAIADGGFDAMVEFSNAMIDDPEIELAKYISRDRSTINTSRYIDRELDAIYDRLPGISDLAQRRAITRDFERLLFDRAYMYPILWFHRIAAVSSRLQGWKALPSHLVAQDLADVWLTP